MKESTQTILYVMRHVDIGGHIDIPYKKIGTTGVGSSTLTSRLQQISGTKSPIKAQCMAAWRSGDAVATEQALHSVLATDRIEGEWFYDPDDDLVDRISPVMELLGSEPVDIIDDSDTYTKDVMHKESESKRESARRALGQISEMLETSLRNSVRDGGPTFFSDRTNLTYYVNLRKSGRHYLDFGRSKDRYCELAAFLERLGFDVEQHARGHAMIRSIALPTVASIIDAVERDFGKH